MLLKRFIVSFQLLFILLLPRVEQSLHFVHDHKEKHCTDGSVHMHGIEHTCDLCDLFSNFSVYIENQSTAEFEQLFDSGIEIHRILNVDFNIIYFIALRGPPGLA